MYIIYCWLKKYSYFLKLKVIYIHEESCHCLDRPMCKLNDHHHHHQPINVPTAGAQAFLMDYTQGERAISHYAGPVRVGTLIIAMI
jgi:hypothetical protein